MAFCDQPKNVSNLWLGSTHLIFCASPPHHQMGLVSFCASPPHHQMGLVSFCASPPHHQMGLVSL